MQPKVIVATAWCSKWEILSCKESLERQRGVEVDWHLVRDLDEYTAHVRLYDLWNESDKCGAIFVKLDPDMQFIDDTALSQLCEFHHKHPSVSHVQCHLRDDMTDTLINGLNSYGERVTFIRPNDPLRPDRGILPSEAVSVYGHQVPQRMNPIGLHAMEVSDAQAFRFGLHRALKNHSSTIQDVSKTWVSRFTKSGVSRKHWLAMYGAEVAVIDRNVSVNYDDTSFKNELAFAVEKFEKLNKEHVK